MSEVEYETIVKKIYSRLEKKNPRESVPKEEKQLKSCLAKMGHTITERQDQVESIKTSMNEQKSDQLARRDYRENEPEKKSARRLLDDESCLREFSHPINKPNIPIVGDPEEDERGKRAKAL